jgi:hypothetical protein
MVRGKLGDRVLKDLERLIDCYKKLNDIDDRFIVGLGLETGNKFGKIVDKCENVFDIDII